MSERPTPETDAEHAQFAMGGFTLDFCRKLERERDEAIEARKVSAADWLSQVENAELRVKHALQIAAKAVKEFDEVNCKLAEETKFHHRTHSELVQTQCKLLDANQLCSELADLVAYGLGQSGEPWSLAAMRQATDAIQKAKALEVTK